MSANSPQELQAIYRRRFDQTSDYRNRVWRILCDQFFGRFIDSKAKVLDLGCGYGEFINNIPAAKKWGMDLNPATRERLSPDVTFLEQDCSAAWPLAENSLDAVFTSNFFEHLPDKACLSRTLGEIHRALRPGGCVIAMGPNIRYLTGEYWDFYDHHVILTEKSLSEAMSITGLEVEMAVPKFLPYTLVNTRPVPDLLIRLYLMIPLIWRIKGRQFLVIARKH